MGNATGIKWAAKLTGVHDITLAGKANLSYWTAKLKSERLVPIEQDGWAQVSIIGVNSKYMGIKFREVLFSIAVQDENQANSAPGAYLLQAYNTSGLLTWCEQTFFSVPYAQEECDVRTPLPPKIRVSRQDVEIFRAEMASFEGGDPREPIRSGIENWSAQIFIPNPKGGPPAKWFQAQIEGETKVYAFETGKDFLGIDPSRMCPPLRLLVDSDFTPTEWHVRHSSSHFKSKTYRRTS